jgi:hypothetical protein
MCAPYRTIPNTRRTPLFMGSLLYDPAACSGTIIPGFPASTLQTPHQTHRSCQEGRAWHMKRRGWSTCWTAVALFRISHKCPGGYLGEQRTFQACCNCQDDANCEIGFQKGSQVAGLQEFALLACTPHRVFLGG